MIAKWEIRTTIGWNDINFQRIKNIWIHTWRQQKTFPRNEKKQQLQWKWEFQQVILLTTNLTFGNNYSYSLEIFSSLNLSTCMHFYVRATIDGWSWRQEEFTHAHLSSTNTNMDLKWKCLPLHKRQVNADSQIVKKATSGYSNWLAKLFWEIERHTHRSFSLQIHHGFSRLALRDG